MMNYSKKIVMMLVTASCLLVACGPTPQQKLEEQQRLARELNDSINRLMMTGDSAKIFDALALNDQLLQLDTVRENQFRYYMQRVSMFYQLGRDADAFEIQEKAMLLLPEDNYDRLNYFAIKNEKLGNTEKAEFFFTMALEACNEALEHGAGKDALINKAAILYYQGKKDEAHKVIEDAYLQHQNDEDLKSMATGSGIWDEIEASTQKMKAIKLEQPAKTDSIHKH